MGDTGRVIVVSGPSGVGKGTVIKELQKLHDNSARSVSVTSRKPRIGEIEGVHYFFKSKSEFEEMIEDDQFIEWDVFVGNYYGTSRSYIERLLAEGKDALLDITYKGAFNIRENFPECILVFVLPPSFAELKRRLVARGTESADEIEKRMLTAESEIEYINRFDYYVINDDARLAAERLRSFIVAEECRINDNVGNITGKIIGNIHGKERGLYNT
ncbi:MAG: guanylate kinase [Oscillospiraceae bacterium]|nr:guanylate kinase [Oscillospiraceae bacterium]